MGRAFSHAFLAIETVSTYWACTAIKDDALLLAAEALFRRKSMNTRDRWMPHMHKLAMVGTSQGHFYVIYLYDSMCLLAFCTTTHSYPHDPKFSQCLPLSIAIFCLTIIPMIYIYLKLRPNFSPG